MNHHSPVRRLPVELLSMVFDSLELQDLLTASHLSTFCRAVALDHQTYWRDVKLRAVSPTAIDFFHARLKAGGNKTVTLRVLLSKLTFPVPHLRSAIIPTIRRNLFRTDNLVLDIDISYEVEIFATLRHPAPRLHTLNFALNHDHRSSDAMPPDLFACQAPNLRDVRIGDILLQTERFPTAFSAITALRYCSSKAISFPTAFFAHSKSLKKLEIYAKSVFLAPTTDQVIQLETTLQSLDISVASGGGFDLVQRMPCADIPDITVVLYDYPSVHLLLRHLRGPLELRTYHTEHCFYMQYQSLDTGTTRRFACTTKHIARAYLPLFYVNELAARVQTLHSTATAAGILSAFSALASCTRVVLTVADGEVLHPPQRVVSIPGLQVVEISSTTSAHLSTSDLATFLDAAFAPLSRVVRLDLKGITLNGDPGALPSARFSVFPTQG